MTVAATTTGPTGNHALPTLAGAALMLAAAPLVLAPIAVGWVGAALLPVQATVHVRAGGDPYHAPLNAGEVPVTDLVSGGGELKNPRCAGDRAGHPKGCIMASRAP